LVKVDELFSDCNKSNPPCWALTVIQDSEILNKHGYGMADIERDIPVFPNK
jgi:hypothetical protein